MGEDKKNPFFTLSHPLPPPPRPPLPAGKHAPSSFVSVLFFLPSSSAHPRFFGSQRDHVTKKTLFYFPTFYIFFLLFPGWSPSVERTHTHTRCLQSRAAPVCFPPPLLSRHTGKKIFSRQPTLENDCSTVLSRSLDIIFDLWNLDERRSFHW